MKIKIKPNIFLWNNPKYNGSTDITAFAISMAVERTSESWKPPSLKQFKWTKSKTLEQYKQSKKEVKPSYGDKTAGKKQCPKSTLNWLVRTFFCSSFHFFQRNSMCLSQVFLDALLCYWSISRLTTISLEWIENTAV